jgi:hypothetical protein
LNWISRGEKYFPVDKLSDFKKEDWNSGPVSMGGDKLSLCPNGQATSRRGGLYARPD